MCVANNCFLMIISSASHYIHVVMEEHTPHNLPLKVWQNLQFDAHLHFADSIVAVYRDDFQSFKSDAMLHAVLQCSIVVAHFRAPGLQAESNFVGNLGLPIFIKNDGRKGQLYHS